MRITFIIIFIILLFIPLVPDDECCPTVAGPGGDHADDNYSYYDGLSINFAKSNYLKNVEFLLYETGYYKNFSNLLKIYSNDYNILEKSDFIQNLNFAPKVLLIPSGGLISKTNEISLMVSLKQYVSSGGTIIVFAQQFGEHVDKVVPVPVGESLKTYGWREDQSCVGGNSAYKRYLSV